MDNFFKIIRKKALVIVLFALAAVLSSLLLDFAKNKTTDNLLQYPQIAVIFGILIGVLCILILAKMIQEFNELKLKNQDELSKIYNKFEKLLNGIKSDLSSKMFEAVDTANISFEKLAKSVDVKFEYFPIENELKAEKLFKESKKIIELSRREIRALNSYAEERPYNIDKDNKFRENYFIALNTIMLDRKYNDVKYTRIVQLDKEQKLSDIYHESYLNHFRKMLEVRKSQAKDRNKHGKIHLKKTRPIFPSTFIIVDNNYLLWQLNEIAPIDECFLEGSKRDSSKKGRMRIRGVVIITDEKGKFIKDFEDMFERASRDQENVAENDF